MQNQNKTVMDIDERSKGRKGIEDMLNRMSDLERKNDSKVKSHSKKETA